VERWTIYCHTLIADGRRYVGLTKKTMLARWNDHVYKAKSSKGGRWHFPNAIRKYGPEAFSHEVLEVCEDLDVANLAEECWIELYDTRNPEKGFNLAKGGIHVPHRIRKNPWDRPEYREKLVMAAQARWGDPVYRAKVTASNRAIASLPQTIAAHRVALNTPESKARRSLASREALNAPESKEKRAASSTGRTHSAESRAKMSLSQKTRIRSTALILAYARRAEAADARECSATHICSVHGVVSVADCHKRLVKGRYYFSCKTCKNRKRQEARASGRP